MKVVVGLGNPGPQYVRSRHNVGFWCVELLSRHMGVSLQRRKLALVAQGSLAGHPVILAKPRTFMNLSGEAVRYLVDRFHVYPEDLIIISDDMDLPPGKIRIRPGGSAGGHNGLQSIISHLGTLDFPRIRIGIGHPTETDSVSHVLGSLTRQDVTAVNDAVEQAVLALETILTDGLHAAMNHFN